MAYKRISPAPIIEGGTNATTMTHTNGTTYYDGTRLVTVSPGTATYVYKSAGAGSPPAFITNDTFVSNIIISVFTASDTWVIDPQTRFVIIEVIGGGAGGGGCAQGTNAGHIAAAGGGGSGAYSMTQVGFGSVGASEVVTVGAGGAGGAAGNNPGTNGGASSVGPIVSANGGQGGSGSAVALNLGIINGAGAGGAQDTGAFINAAGSPGGTGLGFFTATTNRWASGGSGGGTRFGGGAQSPIVGITSAANAGINASAGGYGSGGSGAVLTGVQAAQAGGNGLDGIVIITEYVASDS